MKFGKRLLDQCVPEWTQHYLAYKSLKGVIKRVVSAQKIALLGASSQEAKALLASYDPPIGTVEDERARFERELMADVEKINSFYLLKENEFKITFSRTFEPLVTDLLAHPERLSTELSELRPFFDFCQQLDDLRNFTVLNYIGVVKICKKYDKKTEADYKRTFQAVLSQQPFYTSTILATLFTEVQCLCAQLIWHTNKVAPSAQDFTCPICKNILQDPVVLSCTHKFCRQCLSDVCGPRKSSSCPVCEKKFDALDPANYRVDNILDQFVQVHFRPQTQKPQPQHELTRSDSFMFRTLGATGEAELQSVLSPPSGSSGAQPRPSPALEASASSARIASAYASKGAGTQLKSINVRALVGSLTSTLSARHMRHIALMVGCTLTLLFLISSPHWRRSLGVSGSPDASSAASGGDGKGAAGVPFPVVPLPSFENAVFVGHLKNDADSVCSAIAAADLWNGVAAMADAVNPETAYLLSRFELEPPLFSTDPSLKGKHWCLLDFNQQDKVPEGVDVNQLLCVIDHHQLMSNAVEVEEPRMVDIQPVGSTCTILTYKYFQASRAIPKHVAGCLLGGILSDTVNLRGPTTTEADRVAVEYLVKAAEIADVEELVMGMFEAKSDTNGLPARTVVLTDFKEFALGDQRIGIGVAETLKPDLLIKRKDELRQASFGVKEEHKLDLMFFIIVDVHHMKSYIVGLSDAEETVIVGAFKTKVVEQHLYDVGNKVSRKKDFLPALSKYFRVAPVK